MAGNLDATDLTAGMQLLTGTFDWERMIPTGGYAIVEQDRKSVQCEMFLMSNLPTELPRLILPDGVVSPSVQLSV